MKSLLNTSFFLVGLLVAVPFVGTAQEAEADEHKAEKAAALKSALSWLELADEDKFSKTYDATAALFQKNVTKEDWKKSLEGVRSPLGKVVSREVAAQRYLTQMPGAPDGEYVVLQFRTEFENKKEAMETVTPIKENGEWKVSGYFIK